MLWEGSSDNTNYKKKMCKIKLTLKYTWLYKYEKYRIFSQILNVYLYQP